MPAGARVPDETREAVLRWVERGVPAGEIVAHHNISYSQLCAIRWPEKVEAREKLQMAVRVGDIERPDTCEKCGRSDMAIQAHHDDYSQPYDVRWLCAPCHGAEHVGEGYLRDLRTLTDEEKRAIWAVATAAQIPQGDLLALMTLDEVLHKYRGWIGARPPDPTQTIGALEGRGGQRGLFDTGVAAD